MNEKKYKDYLKHECPSHISNTNWYIFDNLNFKQILLRLLKEQKINFDEAMYLNKILKKIMQYDTLEDMIQCENSYYRKFNCKTESDKINLEIGYLRTKLLKDYSDQNVPLDIVDALLTLEKIEILLSSHIDDDLLSLIKSEIILLELKLNIEIKFFYEAHEYLKDKIYKLNMN